MKNMFKMGIGCALATYGILTIIEVIKEEF